MSGEPVPVTIYGKTYYLRGDGEPSALVEIASAVDRKMKELAETTGTADTLKLAILAALNFAEECSGIRRTSVPGEARVRLTRLVSLLDEALLAGQEGHAAGSAGGGAGDARTHETGRSIRGDGPCGVRDGWNGLSQRFSAGGPGSEPR